MLQVAVHRDDDFAVRIIKAGLERRCLAKVSAQTNQGHARIAVRNLSEDLVTAIATSIVDEYHFVRVAESVHYFDDALVKGPDIVHFVEERNDNRKINRRSGKLAKAFFFHDASLSSRYDIN